MKLSRARDYMKLVDPSDVVVVVLGGGRGGRLYPLTRDRAKPAVSFGGKYRLIDITMTNCLRSRFERIYVLTQFSSFSLNRHIWQAYSREVHRGGFIDVIAAERRTHGGDWFQGTADAVRQSLQYILYHRPRYVLVLCADQIYSIDYRRLLFHHETRRADVTIAANYTSPKKIQGLGVVAVDRDLRVVGFREKPHSPSDVHQFRLDTLPSVKFPSGKPLLGSMGIYLFNTSTLVKMLEGDEQDFGRGVIPKAAELHHMSCYAFDGYWRDVGTIESLYWANMDWRAGRGVVTMFQDGHAILTHSRQLPPSRIDGTRLHESIIADGCHIRASSITRSIIGVRARIDTGCVVDESILMGNDADDCAIGPDCRIRRAIIDKNVVIGEGSTVVSDGHTQDADEDLYSLRSGIIVIPRGTVIPPGTSL